MRGQDALRLLGLGQGDGHVLDRGGQARRPPSRSVSSRPASPPKSRNRQQAERGYTRSNTTASGLSARDGKAADPSVGRSFILRPFPLMGTTKIPARNDRTRAVPPRCAA